MGRQIKEYRTHEKFTSPTNKIERMKSNTNKYGYEDAADKKEANTTTGITQRLPQGGHITIWERMKLLRFGACIKERFEFLQRLITNELKNLERTLFGIAQEVLMKGDPTISNLLCKTISSSSSGICVAIPITSCLHSMVQPSDMDQQSSMFPI